MPETFSSARQHLEPLIAQGVVPVLGGFIGSTRDGKTTTLGRGGSDYTAALIGAALEANEIQIWTDVPGVLTADPRLVPHAQTVPHLSFEEAAELAYFGAKVLHPKTLHPAIERDIPVRICNSRAQESGSTLVIGESRKSPQTVKAIAHKTGVTTVQVTSTRMLGAYGFLRALFEVFDEHRTAVDVVTTSEVSVSLSLDDTSSLPQIVAQLERLGTVSVEADRAIVCVVGEGLRSTPGIAARIFSTINDINVSLISQGASRINLTFAVEESRIRETVCRLHKEFFEIAESEDAQRELQELNSQVVA
jgi:aspartate kinase